MYDSKRAHEWCLKRSSLDERHVLRAASNSPESTSQRLQLHCKLQILIFPPQSGGSGREGLLSMLYEFSQKAKKGFTFSAQHKTHRIRWAKGTPQMEYGSAV